jgi:hypothetical protein
MPQLRTAPLSPVQSPLGPTAPCSELMLWQHRACGWASWPCESTGYPASFVVLRCVCTQTEEPKLEKWQRERRRRTTATTARSALGLLIPSAGALGTAETQPSGELPFPAFLFPARDGSLHHWRSLVNQALGSGEDSSAFPVRWDQAGLSSSSTDRSQAFGFSGRAKDAAHSGLQHPRRQAERHKGSALLRCNRLLPFQRHARLHRDSRCTRRCAYSAPRSLAFNLVEEGRHDTHACTPECEGKDAVALRATAIILSLLPCWGWLRETALSLCRSVECGTQTGKHRRGARRLQLPLPRQPPPPAGGKTTQTCCL